MSDSLRGSAVRRFDGRKVYAEAIEAGSQAAPSPGHAAALLQTGAFLRSRAPPSLRLCLRSPAPDASPQARHGSIPGRASCLRLGPRPRTLPRPQPNPCSRRRRARVLNTGSSRVSRSLAMEANSRPAECFGDGRLQLLAHRRCELDRPHVVHPVLERIAEVVEEVGEPLRTAREVAQLERTHHRQAQTGAVLEGGIDVLDAREPGEHRIHRLAPQRDLQAVHEVPRRFVVEADRLLSVRVVEVDGPVDDALAGIRSAPPPRRGE